MKSDVWIIWWLLYCLHAWSSFFFFCQQATTTCLLGLSYKVQARTWNIKTVLRLQLVKREYNWWSKWYTNPQISFRFSKWKHNPTFPKRTPTISGSSQMIVPMSFWKSYSKVKIIISNIPLTNKIFVVYMKKIIELGYWSTKKILNSFKVMFGPAHFTVLFRPIFNPNLCFGFTIKA